METREKAREIKIKYVIPDDLRDLTVSGFWGGITPSAHIHMHAFSERQPLPNKEKLQINQDGEMIEQPDIEAGGDIIRLVQASLVMDYATAVQLREWLDEKITLLETHF